jgi:hypothetical protein
VSSSGIVYPGPRRVAALDHVDRRVEAVDPLSVEVALLREEHERVHGLRRPVCQQLDHDRAARSLHLRRVGGPLLHDLLGFGELRLRRRGVLGLRAAARDLGRAGLGLDGVRAPRHARGPGGLVRGSGRARGTRLRVVAADERDIRDPPAHERDHERDHDRRRLTPALLVPALGLATLVLPRELAVSGLLRHGGTGYRTARDRTEWIRAPALTDPVGEPPEGRRVRAGRQRRPPPPGYPPPRARRPRRRSPPDRTWLRSGSRPRPRPAR